MAITVKKLDTRIVKTTIVTDIKVTQFVHDFEQETCAIGYITLLQDGTPFQRGVVPVSGDENINLLCNLIDDSIAKGNSFASALDIVLTSKVFEYLGQ